MAHETAHASTNCNTEPTNDCPCRGEAGCGSCCYALRVPAIGGSGPKLARSRDYPILRTTFFGIDGGIKVKRVESGGFPVLPSVARVTRTTLGNFEGERTVTISQPASTRWLPATTAAVAVLAVFVAGISGCSSSSDSPSPSMPAGPPPPPPPPTFDTQYRASAGASPFSANCDGSAVNGTNFSGAEVEPSVAINPRNPQNLIGFWQQDRWSNGGAHGLVGAASFDGGQTWARQSPPFSRCGGGTAANGGNYARASDPWVSFGPDGTAYAIALSFDGAVLMAGSDSAMLVSRSSDGGLTWGAPITLIHDGANFLDDKESITADPNDARFVYAVWDRLSTMTTGPSYFTRSTDGGQSWETARAIYDPGTDNQTLGNVIVVLPNGILVDVFAHLSGPNGGPFTSILEDVRSTDNGVTWSPPFKIADYLGVGAKDPDTATLVRDSTAVPQIAVAPNGDLYVVWQDARFSAGSRDGIALSTSNDGGMTWAAPVQINGNHSTIAFIPTIHIRNDGMIGVTYFDFRDNTTDAATLPTDYWLTRSIDASTWQESEFAYFDLDYAPHVPALFIGDYQALTSIDNVFVPFFAQTNTSVSNRTDIFAAPAVSVASASLQGERPKAVATAPTLLTVKATPAAPFEMSAEFRRRVSENIVRSLEPAWYRGWQRRHNIPVSPQPREER